MSDSLTFTCKDRLITRKAVFCMWKSDMFKYAQFTYVRFNRWAPTWNYLWKVPRITGGFDEGRWGVVFEPTAVCWTVCWTVCWIFAYMPTLQTHLENLSTIYIFVCTTWCVLYAHTLSLSSSPSGPLSTSCFRFLANRNRDEKSTLQICFSVCAASKIPILWSHTTSGRWNTRQRTGTGVSRLARIKKTSTAAYAAIAPSATTSTPSPVNRARPSSAAMHLKDWWVAFSTFCSRVSSSLIL